MEHSGVLRIALGDIRHRTVGRHSALMPIGVGFVASFAKQQLGDAIEIRMYEDPHLLLHDIASWRPNIIGLSNFIFNAELNRRVFQYSKEINPSVVTVAGGPELPSDLPECEAYLLECRDIDFFAYFEGEVAFAQLVERLLHGTAPRTLKSTSQQGIMSIHPETDELCFGGVLPRIKDLNTIPSPYLTGLMDQWFDGTHAPLIQTTRGCPYSCAYCRASVDLYKKTTKFDTERVKQELTYIAERVTDYPALPLVIVDSNFGLFERDEEIAEYIRWLQDRYNWPDRLWATTNYMLHDRVLRIAELVRHRMSVGVAVQSLNPETARFIKRKNVPMSEYRQKMQELNKRRIDSHCELILGLPMETKESFFAGIKQVIDAGVGKLDSFTYMFLKATDLARPETRAQYGMQSRFRLLSHQFGEYKGKKCFEVEEVCIATSSLSFEDYLDCRGFGFIVAVFADVQYDLLRRHLSELSLGFYDFLFHLWNHLTADDTDTVFSRIYRNFLKETEEELWESQEAFHEHFSKPENYERLLLGEVGDNLIRKYRTTAFSTGFASSIDLVYESISNLVDRADGDVLASLEAAKQWTLAVRNISEVFQNQEAVTQERYLAMKFDVNRWYGEGEHARSLWEYKSPVTYRLFYDVPAVEHILRQSQSLYGDAPDYAMSKVFLARSARDFWRKCESDFSRF